MLRLITLGAGLLLFWSLVVVISGVPQYILPGPAPVFQAVLEHWPVLLGHLQTTLAEILLGIFMGTFLGIISALVMNNRSSKLP